MPNSLHRYGLQPIRLICPQDSPGKSTGVDCYALLQGIFLTQGSNLSLMSPALADGFFTISTTWEAPINFGCQVNSRFKKNYSLGIQKKIHFFFFFQISLRATYSQLLCLSQRGSNKDRKTGTVSHFDIMKESMLD